MENHGQKILYYCLNVGLNNLYYDQDLEKGLLQKEFVLSEEPELGDWKIHFIAGPVSSKATFKVSEYVLPKFDVSYEHKL